MKTSRPGTVIPDMNPEELAQRPPDLASLIATLPEEERAVLLLHYVQGRTTAEIAELLGVPERAVVSVLASGRARLTGALGI